MWKHLAGCAVGLVVVAGLLLLPRDAVPGLVLIALICPAMMIGMMVFMRHDHQPVETHDEELADHSTHSHH